MPAPITKSNCFDRGDRGGYYRGGGGMGGRGRGYRDYSDRGGGYRDYGYQQRDYNRDRPPTRYDMYCITVLAIGLNRVTSVLLI